MTGGNAQDWDGPISSGKAIPHESMDVLTSSNRYEDWWCFLSCHSSSRNMCHEGHSREVFFEYINNATKKSEKKSHIGSKSEFCQSGAALAITYRSGICFECCAQRIRLDCERGANHNLNHLLDKPGYYNDAIDAINAEPRKAALRFLGPVMASVGQENNTDERIPEMSEVWKDICPS